MRVPDARRGLDIVPSLPCETVGKDTGYRMTSFVWAELEDLSRQLANTQKRLEAAKSVGSFDLADLLEQEIAEMEERRGSLLTRIANGVLGEEIGVDDTTEVHDVNGAPEKEEKIEATEQQAGQVEKDEDECTGLIVLPSGEAPEPEAVPRNPGIGTVQHDPKERGKTMQVTLGDVDRAKQNLERQRTEILARHTEELKSLDAECAEVEALEQAIASFVRKFSGSAARGEVVQLDSANQWRA